MNEPPCTAPSRPACKDCTIPGRLMCRFDQSDMLHFFMLTLPLLVTGIGGVIAAGYGWFLLGWLAYAVFFFFVWEARVLCSHCPYWAEENRVLHCHANYGVIKIWKYHPQPMSRAEQIQFAVGAIALALYPLVFLLLGREYLLAAVFLVSCVSWGYLLRRHVCIRCVNFSCPMNAVPKTSVDAYLRQHPVVRSAWERCGYKLD
ncbi:MAG: hypothetical protein JW748_01870 [Anaerolineales bacterium]|nr:hypothetical protein [Anaerolineales bacterium]